MISELKQKDIEKNNCVKLKVSLERKIAAIGFVLFRFVDGFFPSLKPSDF